MIAPFTSKFFRQLKELLHWYFFSNNWYQSSCSDSHLIQLPLLQPIKLLQFKRDNLVARNARESKIAKRNDVPFNWVERQGEVSSVTELIKKHYSFKCANVLCGRMISTLNPVYCMIVFSFLGKIINKFYFCSKECNDKMKIRTGALIPVIRKEIPMQEFF